MLIGEPVVVRPSSRNGSPSAAPRPTKAHSIVSTREKLLHQWLTSLHELDAQSGIQSYPFAAARIFNDTRHRALSDGPGAK